MKFVVDRQTWYRGKGETQSRLLTEDGQRCCIGFVASQCGVPADQLLDTAAVHQVNRGSLNHPLRISLSFRELLPKWMTASTGSASLDLDLAYALNDEMLISDERREAGIKDIFLDHGDEIEFIN